MCPAALFEGQRLVDSGTHVRIFFQFFVIKEVATFPQWTNSLHTGELVGFLPFVGHNGKLVAPCVAFTLKFIEDGVLHEVGFHVYADCRIFGQ